MVAEPYAIRQEIDECYGDNEGLIMAEVELSDEQEAFEKPGFIGREVTGDRRYYNSHLRTYPLFSFECHVW